MPDTWRGHTITERGGTWVYEDTNVPVASQKDRPCGHCNLPNRDDGHDACLGVLPGVMNACCGHGDTGGYVQYTPERIMDEQTKAVRDAIYDPDSDPDTLEHRVARLTVMLLSLRPDQLSCSEWVDVLVRTDCIVATDISPETVAAFIAADKETS